MSRMQDNSSLAPDIISPSPTLALQHIAPSPRNQYGNDYSGYRQPQQALLVPASFSANQNSTKRSQRTGPLSVSGKMKAAAVRKKRACFRCGLLKTSVCERLPRNLLSHPIAENNSFNSATKIGHVQNAKKLPSLRAVQES